MARQRGNLVSLHRRRKLLAAPLSPELRKKHGCRSLPVRRGDKVKLTHGDFKGMEGEVIEVDSKRCRINIEDVKTTKADESEVPQFVHPSNVIITKLGVGDKVRDKILKRRSVSGQKRTEKAS
jgi:large subunit ribosomal protein L24